MTGGAWQCPNKVCMGMKPSDTTTATPRAWSTRAMLVEKDRLVGNVDAPTHGPRLNDHPNPGGTADT